MPVSRSSSASVRSGKAKPLQKPPAKEPGLRATPVNTVPMEVPVTEQPRPGPRFSDTAIFFDGTVPPKAGSSPKPASSKPKSKPKPKKGPDSLKPLTRPVSKTSWFRFLLRLSLFFTALYALRVCPTERAMDHAVCRAVYHYRQVVLEPHILLYARRVYEHPAVERQLEFARPYYTQVVETASPYVKTAQKQWSVYGAPRVDQLTKQSNIYMRQAELQYDRHLAPTVNLAAANLAEYWEAAQPYISRGAAVAQQGWETAGPYVEPVWEKAQEVPGYVRKYVIRPALDSWERWGDPQVRRMWAKVEELASGTSSSKKSKTPEGNSFFPSANAKMVMAAEYPEARAGHEWSFEPSVLANEAAVTGAASNATPKSARTARTTSKVLSAEECAYLDEWVLNLEPETPAAQVPIQEEETPAEREERLREKAADTAEKRAEIESRHTEWEQKLEAQGIEKQQLLVDTITQMRLDAAEDLATGWIQDEVDQLLDEADRAVNGTLLFLKKLMNEPEEGVDSALAWDELHTKVLVKFSKTVSRMEDSVRTWLTTEDQREALEVNNICKAILLYADVAQGDLGLDYAWLDDVSPNDWKRYHALVDRAKIWENIYKEIFSGALEELPENPIFPVLNDLQTDLSSFIQGFYASLDKIKRDGHAKLQGTYVDDADDEDCADTNNDTVSILPIDTSIKDKAASTPPVVIGRGKKEVEEAMQRAASATGAHVEL